MTVIGLAVPEPVRAVPPFVEEHETLYEVMALPPVEAGAANDTISEPVAEVVEPERAVGVPGVPGTVAGTKEDDADEAAPVPLAFVAETAHV